MCNSARSPGPRHVAAAMFTPASLIAAATCASAPGVFSTSITRSTAIRRTASCHDRSSADGDPLLLAVRRGHEDEPALRRPGRDEVAPLVPVLQDDPGRAQV